MAPIPTLLSASLALLLQLAVSRSIERRYDKDEIQIDQSKHDEQFFNFVTRSDIDAPRWDITVHDEDALADGLWFTAPYGIVGQTDHKKAYVGPHIYDGKGELVWSGAKLFDGYDAFDFKVSNVEGRDMLTAIWPHKGIVAIIDENYKIYKKIHIGDEKDNTLNLHDFQMIENGTRAMFPTKIPKRASHEMSQTVDYNGKCNVEFDGFEERDIKSGKRLFEWTSEEKIELTESTIGGKPEQKCGGKFPGGAWDYFHINSVEKLPDNDYLISGRRTYALYKVSHLDGSILWRLGGKASDFEWRGADAHFSGQHDARFLSQNATHMLVSIMDNASGPGQPYTTNANSRGLVLALQTGVSPMIVEVVAKYDHPLGKYAPARGNFQTLPNGNAFICWTTDALHSEHTPDGTSILEAKLQSGLKSYRNYKMPWVGRPSAPPDVVSQTVEKDNGTDTAVYVSWNGDTETRFWQLYKTTSKGLQGRYEAVALSSRQGFETALLYPGYAKFVVVEALDAEGNVLATSKVIKTPKPDDRSSEDFLAEMQWLHGGADVGGEQSLSQMMRETAEEPFMIFFGGCLSGVAAGLTIWAVLSVVRRRRDRASRVVEYDTVREEKELDLDDDVDETVGLTEGKEREYED